MSRAINKGLLGVMIFFSVIIGFVMGLNLGGEIYANPQVEETHRQIRKYIKELKKVTLKPEDTYQDKESNIVK